MTHSSDFAARVQHAIDHKTKPLGALGRIETLAAQIADIQHTLEPHAESCTLCIFAGDHGMAREGVSAFPSEVTRQMVLNFLDEGAAANVFANALGAEIRVIDAGIAGAPIEHERLVSKRLGAGTQNAIETSAMSDDQLAEALRMGEEIGQAIESDVACFGEMGIGNTSSASLIAAKVLARPVADLVGRGTGLDDNGLNRKSDLLSRAAARTLNRLSARDALKNYGGFEIAMMCGAMIGAFKNRRIIIVDGFIASAAALCTVELEPNSRRSLVFGHQSAELGHGIILDALQAQPLLQLDLRLGEGTGALLAWPLVKAAAAMLRDMASFDTAGVSGPA